MAKSQVKRKGASRRKKNLEKQMQRDPNLAARIEAEEEARRRTASLKKADREEALNRVKKDPTSAFSADEAPALKNTPPRTKQVNKATPSAPKKPSKPSLNSRERRERFRKRAAAAVVIAVVMALIVTLALVVLPGGNPGTGIVTSSVINNLTGVGFEGTS